MEETSKTEEAPANAPWKLDWKTVAKSSGTYVEPVEKEKTYVQKVLEEKTKPWLIDWGKYSQEQPRKPSMAPSSFLKEPAIPAQGRTKQTAPTASDGGYDFESVVRNLIQAESKGKHTDKEGKLTTSPVGAKGITQVMRKTGEDPGYGVAPLKDESENEYIRFGRDYLRAMLNEFGGDYRKALAAYNYGPGSVKKAISASRRSGEDWLSHTPTETKSYVSKILGNRVLKSKMEMSESEQGLLSSMNTMTEDDYRALPSISLQVLKDKGLLTSAGRSAYQTKWEEEAVKKKKPKSAWVALAEKEEPLAYQAFDTLQSSGDIPSRLVNSPSLMSKMVSFPRMGGAAGFVLSDGKSDGRIFLDYGADFNTVAHEALHTGHVRIQQQGRELPETKHLKNPSSPIRKLFDLVRKDREHPEFKKVFRAENSLDNAEEFMANFQGYTQASIPEGVSWSQTPFYKTLVSKVGEKETQSMIIAMMTTLMRANMYREEFENAKKR